MQKYILLFRSINVGGNNLLPMKEFVTLLTKHEYKDISYYIQSGNVVLMSAANPVEHIRALVLEFYGFSPEIFVLTTLAFETIHTNNPYTEFQGKWVHCYICKDKIELDTDKLETLMSKTEEYTVIDNVFYLHAPDGIGKSKLVANLAACFGQQTTGRNLNTMNKIHKLITE